MANFLKSYLKKLFSDLHSAILSIFVSAIVLGVGGIWAFSKVLWIKLKTTMLLPTPLWVTAMLVLLLLICIHYLKKASVPLSTPDPEYREEFHVLWDKDYKMRCLNCGKPLKYSSSDTDPSIFFCSDPRCNSKHILKDKHGNKMSEEEAIDLMKTNQVNL
jgi:DNA-directed RNA polymerase subunit RPC12/RpoP